MNYLEARWALNRVVKFQKLYMKFMEAQRGGDAVNSWQHQQELARLSTSVQHDLARVDKGHFILTDAPVVGGRQHLTEVASVAYQPRLAAEYHIREQELFMHFESVIGEYLRLSRLAFWNLFNPLWWVREIIAAIVSLPFYLIGLAGFDRQVVESSLLGRVFKLLAELALVAGAIVTIVEFAR